MQDTEVQEHRGKDTPVLPRGFNQLRVLGSRVDQYIGVDIQAPTQYRENSIDDQVDSNNRIRHEGGTSAYCEASTHNLTLHPIRRRPRRDRFALRSRTHHCLLLVLSYRRDGGRHTVARGISRFYRRETVLKVSTKREARGPRTSQLCIVILMQRTEQVRA